MTNSATLRGHFLLADLVCITYPSHLSIRHDNTELQLPDQPLAIVSDTPWHRFIFPIETLLLLHFDVSNIKVL
jgi:hypothetical protein